MKSEDVRRAQWQAEEMSGHDGPQALGTIDLLKQIKQDATELFKLELELAKSEARQDFKHELDLAKGVAGASVCAVLGLNMLIVAAVLAWAPSFQAIAALLVGIVLLVTGAIAAFAGMQEAKQAPLKLTRETLKGDAEWAKQQITQQPTK